VLGWPGCSLLEFEELMEGIPLTGQSITLLGSSAPTVLRLAYVVALARKRGIDPSEVHGSVMESPFENYFGQTDVQPFDLNLKLWLDASEYVVRNKIRMRSSVISQHFQESGGNNAQAVAVVLSMYKELCGKLVNERGLDFDDAAMVPYELVSIGSRFLRGDRQGARHAPHVGAHGERPLQGEEEKSCQMLIAVHTSGRTMTYQQPLNNIARCAIQTLAGAIVGCTALDNATMDNAYAEPSALAARMSLNTQHIVAHETGVADVVDPLAGSYFVEALTNQVEAEAYRILKEIDDLGGMIAAVEKGYIQTMLREEAAKKFREVDTKERLVVGVNHLVIAPEEDFEIPIQEVHEGDSEAIAERMEAWKPTRDMPLLTARCAASCRRAARATAST
jgi:methylmalonyl-CoA mutase N-terminal domain/subunit